MDHQKAQNSTTVKGIVALKQLQSLSNGTNKLRTCRISQNAKFSAGSGYILAIFWLDFVWAGEAINSPESVREDRQRAQNSTTVTRIVALARKSFAFQKDK